MGNRPPRWKFPADPWSFPTKDEVAAYLEAYAGRWDLPVRLGIRVEGLARAADHGFVVSTDAGRSTATTWWSRPAPSGGRP